MTQRCNLNCDYCGATVEPSIMPVDLNVKQDSLVEFINSHEEPPVIAFYGGEPLTNQQKMIEVMDFADVKAFMIQTNGTKLTKLPSHVIHRFHTILVSVDGSKDITERHRGNNVFDRVIKGVDYLIDNNFQGDLVARMTVSMDTDIFKEVTYLSKYQNGVFNHVHWQLDVMWDTYFEENRTEITDWLLNRYNPGIQRLVDWWVTQIEDTGNIPGIAPFLGITYTLLSKKPSGLRCRAGNDFFSISTDGKITMCPILPSHDFIVGDIYSSKPRELIDKIKLEDPCTSCEVQNVCGGRCLYANKTKFWGDEGFDLVCTTVKFLIESIKQNLGRIQTTMKTYNIDMEQFRYPKIPNGVETIP